MKTKKLFFLTAFLMVFGYTVAIAQNVRGGCTSINCYYNVTGWQDDRASTSNSKDITVANAVALFRCGVGANLQAIKTAGSTFTISVYKNGSETPESTVDETTYGTGNEYELSNPVTTPGDLCKVVITVTPSTTIAGCTGTPWTYTWNIIYPTGCVSPDPIPYYRINDGTWWVNKATTDYTINLEMEIGGKIILGINPGAGSVAWTGCNSFTGTTREFEFDPGFTAKGQSCSISGVYTDAVCGKKTTYTYNLSVPLTCTPPVNPPTFYYNNMNPDQWTDPAIVEVVSGVNTITVPAVMVSGTVMRVGSKNLSGGTITWSDGLAAGEGDRDYTPGFTDDGQTRTVTANYIDKCGTPIAYVFKISSTSLCTPTIPTFYFNDNNGSNWVDPAIIDSGNIITIAPIPFSGTVQAGVHLNGGTVAWSDDQGVGFADTANQIVYNPGFTAGDQTRVLTATYTDACGTPSTYEYHISSTSSCTPSVPRFYYNDGTGWVDPATVVSNAVTVPPLQLGKTVELGAYSNGGSFTWDDGQGFTTTGTGKFQFAYDPKFTGFSQTRTVTGTYLDTCGDTTTYVYTISSAATCIPSVPTFLYNNNNGSGWVDPAAIGSGNTITVPAVFYSETIEARVAVGVYLKGGSITWTDDNGMTPVSNPNNNTGKFQFDYNPGFTDGGQTRTLTGVYTNTCGGTANYVYTITSTSTCISIAPSTRYSIQFETGWQDTTPTGNDIDIDLPINTTTQASVLIQLNLNPGQGDANGTFNWTDSLGLYVDVKSQQITYDGLFDTAGGTCDVTGVYTDKCGKETTYIFHLKAPALGVNKFEQGGFRMYPNPAETNLNIIFNGDLNVSIINVSGQKLISRSINQQGSIDVSSLSKGIYFLKAVVNGESTVKKFIKN